MKKNYTEPEVEYIEFDRKELFITSNSSCPSDCTGCVFLECEPSDCTLGANPSTNQIVPEEESEELVDLLN